ncbi:DUF4870 domain-containing protein [Salipaludibacillus daqingensis]|uniref:DUF4870 domain-containing protein n=1 Tax=Salipaludibacillus daqingensis TaxID=3041001 RepID=UPI002474A9FA|nr:DUF4870 domain-containing protein [Salipaludibacillus daqingensis]
MISQEEKTLALLIYLVSFLTAIIGPLIIWLLKKDESAFIDYHGREYLNLFISYTIYMTVSGILVILLIGFVLLPIVGAAALIFTIIGAVKAYSGEYYRIPFLLRIL